jgi:predicted Holliday junction resolvase-like endonuclease
MRILLFILLFFIFLMLLSVIRIRRMMNSTHNNTFEPRQESAAAKWLRRKFDKNKAEDVKYEEIKEEK